MRERREGEGRGRGVRERGDVGHYLRESVPRCLDGKAEIRDFDVCVVGFRGQQQVFRLKWRLVCLDVRAAGVAEALPGGPKAHLVVGDEWRLVCLDVRGCGTRDGTSRPKTHLGAGWDRGIEAPGYNGIASSRQAKDAP